jgi:hypothetical protein
VNNMNPEVVKTNGMGNRSEAEMARLAERLLRANSMIEAYTDCLTKNQYAVNTCGSRR